MQQDHLLEKQEELYGIIQMQEMKVHIQSQIKESYFKLQEIH